MKVGKKLTIADLNDLKDGDKVYIEYIDEYFNKECINKKYINIYNSRYNKFKDDYDDYWDMELLKEYIDEDKIKVYECIPSTNYERIKNMTIEEMAMSRIKYVENDDAYIGDFSVEDSICDYVYREEEALKREIAWLNSEVEE